MARKNTINFQVAMLPEQREAVKAAADKAGVSLSDFVRDALKVACQAQKVDFPDMEETRGTLPKMR